MPSLRVIRVSGSPRKVSQAIPIGCQKKGSHGDVISDELKSVSSSSVVQVGTLAALLDQWRSITSNRFVLNTMQDHYFQLRCHPPLFCNFWQFNILTTPAYHAIIQKEVDELLAKGPIEPSSGGAGFYSNIFVVPKHTSGLHPFLNLKHFNHYKHIPTFKMPTIRLVKLVFNQEIMLFLLILRMLNYMSLLLSTISNFYSLFGNTDLISGKVLPSGMVVAPRVICTLTKPIPLYHHKEVCGLLFIWMGILVLTP